MSVLSLSLNMFIFLESSLKELKDKPPNNIMILVLRKNFISTRFALDHLP